MNNISLTCFPVECVCNFPVGVFEENVGVGAEEIVANQEYVTYTGDSEEVLEVKIDNNIRHQTANQ